MKDFQERLLSVFEQGLKWAWRDIKIEAIHVKNRVPLGYEPPSESEKKWRSGAYEMIDPSQEYVEIRVYFPEEYKKKYPDWENLGFAAPIPNRCAFILYAFGLGSMLGDSHLSPQDSYIMYYTNINKSVYDRLPPAMNQQLPIELTATSNLKR